MVRLQVAALLLLSLAFCSLVPLCAQSGEVIQLQAPPKPAPGVSAPEQQKAPAVDIAANAPHISKQSRLEIIRDFETQIVYSRTAFPMGVKGLRLKDGTVTPTGEDLQQALAIYGPAVKPGDPAHISFVQIKDDHIRFEINGGPVRRKKWYEHIQVSGANGAALGTPENAQANPHGSFVDLYFESYVPEVTPQQVRDLLFPVLDFNAKSKEEAYLDTMLPKVKEAILAHHVLVGMTGEMVVHAKGRPPKKVREKDGEADYEEWIYGEPPQDVDFVRLMGDEVVRVETMKVGGEKIVRTEKEVTLEREDKEAKKEPDVRQPNAPSLRRPGEDAGEVPKPAEGPSPTLPPPDVPQPGGNGPGAIVASRR